MVRAAAGSRQRWGRVGAWAASEGEGARAAASMVRVRDRPGKMNPVFRLVSHPSTTKVFSLMLAET